MEKIVHTVLAHFYHSSLHLKQIYHTIVLEAHHGLLVRFLENCFDFAANFNMIETTKHYGAPIVFNHFVFSRDELFVVLILFASIANITH